MKDLPLYLFTLVYHVIHRHRKSFSGGRCVDTNLLIPNNKKRLSLLSVVSLSIPRVFFLH